MEGSLGFTPVEVSPSEWPSKLGVLIQLAEGLSITGDHFLTTLDDFQQMPLSSSSNNASIIPASTPSQSVLGASLHDMEGSGFKLGMTPLVDSMLRTIILQDPWVMPMHDLNKILTVYTLNLYFLRVDQIYTVSEYYEAFVT